MILCEYPNSLSPCTKGTDKSIPTADQTLPPLPYEYDALEPAISEQIMRLHHTKHHQIYIDRLNAAEKAYGDAVSINDVPKQMELQSAIKHHGGGHINHSLFWKNLAPVGQGGGQLSEGPLKQAIERDFGSLDKLKDHFNKTSTAILGSGYGWVGYHPLSRRLEVVTTANQDTLTTHHPLIVVDVWEHACYLQYFHMRSKYLEAIWSVINFAEAERRLEEALKKSQPEV